MRVTIEKVSNKYSPVVLVNGNWLKTDDAAFAKAKPGITADIVQDETGFVTSITPVGEASPMITPQQSPQGLPEIDRQRLIVRQSSLKNAIDFAQYRKDTNEQSDLSIQQILTVAGTFEAWVNRKEQ